jgi:hypothetical protein
MIMKKSKNVMDQLKKFADKICSIFLPNGKLYARYQLPKYVRAYLNVGY